MKALMERRVELLLMAVALVKLTVVVMVVVSVERV